MRRLALLLLLLSSPGIAGEPQCLASRSNGTLPLWLVAAGLPNARADAPETPCWGYYHDFLAATGGETGTNPRQGDVITLEPDEGITWQPGFSDTNGVIDFKEFLLRDGGGPKVAYAFCFIRSPRAQAARLQVRSKDGVRIWLNQDLVHDRHTHFRYHTAEDVVAVTLREGDNRLLVKLDQFNATWWFGVAVLDENGQPLTSLSTCSNLAAPLTPQFHSARLTPVPLVKKTPGGDRQKVRLEVVSTGLEHVTCRVSEADGRELLAAPLGSIPVGKYRTDLWLPTGRAGDLLEVTLESGPMKYEVQSCVAPVIKPWTVYLVQHTHTDIGYTRPQSDILPEHLRFVDYALDFCDRTDSYPADSQFRWTCETSWTVREYLKSRPQLQVERLKKRVAEGRIEVTGMYLNLSDIADEATLAASLRPLAECGEALGAPVVTAMQNDVNGMAWCLPEYFAEAGIKYVVMGINKTRSLLPFDRPTPFWWESPSGKRVLAWRPDHYMTGNFMELHQGDLDRFEPLLLDYLQSLDQKDYPFDRVAVQFSGYFTDNSPPGLAACEVVKAWNDRYIYPRLRLATSREFLDYIADHHADGLDVHRRAWPDWWTDGFGSAARETAAARQAQIAMQVNQGLLALARVLGSPLPPGIGERVAAAQDAILFYDEHTFGAAESVTDPLAENTMRQWGEKGAFAWEAVKRGSLLREECLGLLQDCLPPSAEPTIAVFNTLNWARSGAVKVFIDHGLLPQRKGFRLVDAETGEDTPAQKLDQREDGSYWAVWAQAVPPLGYRSYRLVVDEQEDRTPPPEPPAAWLLENAFYELRLDPQTGAIISLRDKQGGELVDPDSPWQLGQFISERLDGDRGSFLGEFQRSTVREVSLTPLADGPIWKSLRIQGAADGLQGDSGFRCEVRLYETEKRLELICRARKLPVTDPEAVYVAFPFAMNQGHIAYEGQGGMITPGAGQIPRSASDWQAIQNYAVVQGDGGQIVWGSVEAPLVQLGGLNLGKWMEITQVDRPHVYSWVMNNYWFTNFRAARKESSPGGTICNRNQRRTRRRRPALAGGRQFPWSVACFPPAEGERRNRPGPA